MTLKEPTIEVLGVVVAPMAAGNFKVRLADTDKTVLARIAGKMIKYHIRITANDQVRVELSPYDMRRARIVYRY